MKIHCLFDRLIPVEELKAHPKNRNKHPKEQIERLAKVLEYQGWRYPIKVSKRSGFITSGHGRLEAAIHAGWNTVPVNYQDYDSDEQEYADLQADNAIALWAELDFSGINADIGSLGPDFDIDLLGIKNFTIDVAETEGLTDEDDVPEPPIEPKTRPGDLYVLGRHRLLCGSSSDLGAVQRLFGGQRADIVFTSPPYNVGRTPNGNENKYLTYQDDQSVEEFLNLLVDFTTNYLTCCDYVFSNIQSVAGNKVALIEYLHKLRDCYADTIIWDKETSEPAMARRVLNSQFEYIHVFSNEAKRTVGKKDFRGTVPNIFRLNSRAGKEFAKIHKATFRVELPEYFISTFVEGAVADPFAGTGTTMLAAEKCGVSSFNMELDPVYCDVIVERWEKFTGQKAVLLGAGEAGGTGAA
jgi:DNA modification methylase